MTNRNTDSTEEDPEFLVGGATDWQLLSAHAGAPDEKRALIFAAQSVLREELGLIVNSEHLVVLAGLGASAGLTSGSGEKSAPKMSDLWSEVEKLASFKNVQGILGKKPIEQRNLEYVLSDAQGRASIDPSNIDLATFITEAENIVLNSCSFIDEKSSVTAHETFLRKVARRSTRLQRAQVFTTNYDLAFETAARRARFNVIDGFGFGGDEFDGGTFDLDFVRRRPNEPPQLEPNVFHLLKLHGSVDWDSSSGYVRKVRDKPHNPVLIYPSAAKYQFSYQQPYLEFMSRFQIALRQSNVGLIIVGFGFNDEHIVAPIQAAIRSNIGLRVIIADPASRSRERSSTFASVEELIGRGDRRLSMLKGSFDDLVRLLPDVPPFEDRDAHFERQFQHLGDLS